MHLHNIDNHIFDTLFSQAFILHYIFTQNFKQAHKNLKSTV